MTDDETQIRSVIADWIEATAKGDLDRVLSLMTDDVEFVTPARTPFGKKEYAENGRAMKGAAFSGASHIREIVVAGRYAFVRNDLSVEITPPGGAPMRLKGPILSVFRKDEDENWRLWRDANFVAPVTGGRQG